ncbi:MAG: methyltransferase domain-containing protein [Candidatus Tectomicrobia bacterium]|uniref:Methyltransferase domain-containing protein n=1 Tax=Tectimicrobiota bacterium TaxID=2528274 RepID=A0A932MLF8_UNCTE|nr:methyltransferase domain-containing protein [Candidatus Tectomicrobia bacterium]
MSVRVGGREPRAWSDQVKDFVRERYAHLCAARAYPPGGRARAREAGYPAAWVEALPDSVAEAYCGCGYALEEVELAGVRLAVDLGCGAGLDARLLAERLGGRGRVLALDFSLAVARRARAAAERAALAVGDMERLPLRDGIADLVIANASLNLTVDKEAALAEAARILRTGGRLVAREMVRAGPLPAEIERDSSAWNASLGGVPEEDEWRAWLAQAGFAGVRISHHRPFPPVAAVRIEAVKA